MITEQMSSQVLSENQKGKQSSSEETEPTLKIQIEQPDNIATGEELMPSSEDKPVNKKKGLFNNPFNKGIKRDTEEFGIETTANVIETATSNEQKSPKGFSNFLYRVKQSTSSNNILSEPTATITTTVFVEEDDDDLEETEEVHVNVTREATPTTAADHKRLQSLLKKFFHNKKETESTRDQEVNRANQHAEDEKVGKRSSSPPLSRRVSNFFNKKRYLGSDKKRKTCEKIEEHVERNTNEAPVLFMNDATATTITTTNNNNVPKGVTA